jgi:hypothetical protein
VAKNRAARGEIKRKTKLKFFKVLTVPTYCGETDHTLRRRKTLFVAVRGVDVPKLCLWLNKF